LQKLFFSGDKGTKGAFHLLRNINSGNSGWDVNGTHVFGTFHYKIPVNEWNFEKVVMFFRWKFSCEKVFFSSFHNESPVADYSRRSWSLPPSWIWWRNFKPMELVPNGTRSSHNGRFRTFFGKWKTPSDNYGQHMIYNNLTRQRDPDTDSLVTTTNISTSVRYWLINC